jgi:hypothetical protein
MDKQLGEDLGRILEFNRKVLPILEGLNNQTQKLFALVKVQQETIAKLRGEVDNIRIDVKDLNRN